MIEVRHDLVTRAQLDRLAALLDRAPGDDALPLAHWLFTLPDAAQAALGRDGHPEHGLVAPPPGLPRRMWAGSRLRFAGALRVGEPVERRSEVTGIFDKPGMTFVTVRHEMRVAGALAVIEEQDLVYLPARGGPDTGIARPVAVPEAVTSRIVTVDSRMLFRFSALTYNAHRIHYDRDYAREVEHYDGLVVHGPLLATLLLDDFCRRLPERQIATFDFRARTPVFDNEPFELCAAGSALWVRTRRGVAMTAQVGLA